jgi:hypothetical protein
LKYENISIKLKMGNVCTCNNNPENETETKEVI